MLISGASFGHCTNVQLIRLGKLYLVSLWRCSYLAVPDILPVSGLQTLRAVDKSLVTPSVKIIFYNNYRKFGQCALNFTHFTWPHIALSLSQSNEPHRKQKQELKFELVRTNIEQFVKQHTLMW